MEKSLTRIEFQDKEVVLVDAQANSRCHACGEEYESPLFAEVLTGPIVEEYYACPRCLTKVKEAETTDTEENDEPAEEEQPETTSDSLVQKADDTSSCPHTMGYLKKRPKNSPIPESCFTCNKMIECMAY